MRNAERLILSGISGRNGADSPLALDEKEAVEVLNMDFTDGALGQKRRGATNETLTGGPTAQLHGLDRFVPPGGRDESAAELWGFGHQGVSTVVTAFRRAPNPDYLWTTPTQPSTIASTDRLECCGATLNGKFFLAYQSSVNRLRVWDGTVIRHVGLMPPPTAATVTNTGAGTYPATLRYYRVAWSEIVGGVDTIRRSELSAAVAFTPSGTGVAARVSRPPAVPPEGQTHWLLYASADDVYSNYKLIATIPFATAAFDDTTAPPNYVGEAPASKGMHIPPPNAKHLITDGNRLLMAGAHQAPVLPGETPVKNNRVWYTRVLGSSDIGDDESIPNTTAVGTTPAQKNWIDVGENEGGAITGMGIIEGVVVVFKRRQTWRLVPTGDDLTPYQAFMVSNAIGALNPRSIVAGEDAAGAPVLYFYSYRGPYTVSLAGILTYIGRQIEDRWHAYPPRQWWTFGTYYAERRQVWHHLYGATAEDHRIAVYDVDRGGWSLFTTAGATFTCAVMYSETVMGPSGLQVASANMKPYFGADTALWKFDVTAAVDDVGTPFRAYIKSRPYFPAGIGTRVLTHDAVLLAEADAGVTLTVTVDRDFGEETRSATVSLTPEASETRVLRRVEDSGFGACGVVQFQIGDPAPVANHWVLEALSVPVGRQEPLA